MDGRTDGWTDCPLIYTNETNNRLQSIVAGKFAFALIRKCSHCGSFFQNKKKEQRKRKDTFYFSMHVSVYLYMFVFGTCRQSHRCSMFNLPSPFLTLQRELLINISCDKKKIRNSLWMNQKQEDDAWKGDHWGERWKGKNDEATAEKALNFISNNFISSKKSLRHVFVWAL